MICRVRLTIAELRDRSAMCCKDGRRYSTHLLQLQWWFHFRYVLLQVPLQRVLVNLLAHFSSHIWLSETSEASKYRRAPQGYYIRPTVLVPENEVELYNLRCLGAVSSPNYDEAVELLQIETLTEVEWESKCPSSNGVNHVQVASWKAEFVSRQSPSSSINVLLLGAPRYLREKNVGCRVSIPLGCHELQLANAKRFGKRHFL